MTLRFSVAGIARPQGSLRSVGGGRLLADNRQLGGWRRDVAWTARVAMRREPVRGPVQLVVTFRLPRPKAVGRQDAPHVHKPDLDKLVRAVGDALTGIVWADDAQVTVMTAAKCYVEVGGEPRIDVEVTTDERTDDGGKADDRFGEGGGDGRPGISTTARACPPAIPLPRSAQAPGPGPKSQKRRKPPTERP